MLVEGRSGFFKMVTVLCRRPVVLSMPRGFGWAAHGPFESVTPPCIPRAVPLIEGAASNYTIKLPGASCVHPLPVSMTFDKAAFRAIWSRTREPAGRSVQEEP